MSRAIKRKIRNVISVGTPKTSGQIRDDIMEMYPGWPPEKLEVAHCLKYMKDFKYNREDKTWIRISMTYDGMPVSKRILMDFPIGSVVTAINLAEKYGVTHNTVARVLRDKRYFNVVGYTNNNRKLFKRVK